MSYQNHMSGIDIYKKLKEDILALKLKPGQMISENEIAGIYSVSRTPIKTAFLRLMGEKYIEIIPQKGSFVTLLDMKYIEDVIYMRAVLETDIISAIINGGLAGKVSAALESSLEKQRALILSPEISPTGFYRVDSEFHHSLFQAAGRERMWDVIQDCQVYYTRFRILDTLTTARYQELFREHEGIARALAAGDAEGIKTLVSDHLHGSLRRLAPKTGGEYKDYFLGQTV